MGHILAAIRPWSAYDPELGCKGLLVSAFLKTETVNDIQG
jgi:hypothetical protein